ncbi:MAG: cadmium resistance transporter [Xanthomonadales bacterium]|nr:cadmium resistance transporter [Xanthomonadales bacterium]
MNEILIVVGVTASAFIGTNMDNFLLLVTMYSRYFRHPGTVAAGYFTGMVLIAAITIAIGKLGDFIPVKYLGLLGIIPMMMGVIAFWKLFRRPQADELDGTFAGNSGLAIFSALVTIQLSNGTDTIITFSTLYADSSNPTDFIVAPAFFAMVGVFAWAAYYSVRHPGIGRFLARYGKYVTPFILILVGFYIFTDTASDLVPG